MGHISFPIPWIKPLKRSEKSRLRKALKEQSEKGDNK